MGTLAEACAPWLWQRLESFGGQHGSPDFGDKVAGRHPGVTRGGRDEVAHVGRALQPAVRLALDAGALPGEDERELHRLRPPSTTRLWPTT